MKRAFLPDPLEEEFKGKDHWETTLALYQARNDPEMVKKYGQQRLADMEHEAFVKGLVEENPAMALPMLFAVPGYDVAKRVGLLGGRSSPGLGQMGAGYKGIWRGLFE